MLYYSNMEPNDTDNTEEKLKNIEEWNKERSEIKPTLEMAIECHNKARREAYWKNYEKAWEFFKQAIENYRNALKLNPKYYLRDIIERVDFVIEEYVNNIFNLKASGDRLSMEQGAREFVEFIQGLSADERKYIDQYELAMRYFKIADVCFQDGNLDRAYEFFSKVADMQCNRPFLNRDTYLKMGEILYRKRKFKEALVSFVSVLSFDMDNAEAVANIDKCLKELKIFEHRFKFLFATPNEAKKLIMEVL